MQSGRAAMAIGFEYAFYIRCLSTTHTARVTHLDLFIRTSGENCICNSFQLPLMWVRQHMFSVSFNHRALSCCTYYPQRVPFARANRVMAIDLIWNMLLGNSGQQRHLSGPDEPLSGILWNSSLSRNFNLISRKIRFAISEKAATNDALTISFIELRRRHE